MSQFMGMSRQRSGETVFWMLEIACANTKRPKGDLLGWGWQEVGEARDELDKQAGAFAIRSLQSKLQVRRSLCRAFKQSCVTALVFQKTPCSRVGGHLVDSTPACRPHGASYSDPGGI